MKTTKLTVAVCLLALAVYGSVRARSANQTNARGSVVERCGMADDVVVRFYYNPMINEPNLSPGPLIILPVSSQDPEVDTKSGWLLRITLSELRGVLRTLVQSNLEWTDSESPRQLVVRGFDLPHPQHDSMEIAVSCPAGSAKAEVEAKQVCALLSNVSKSLSSPQARDAMSFYAGMVSCPSSASR